jgi:hypothetical protein
MAERPESNWNTTPFRRVQRMSFRSPTRSRANCRGHSKNGSRFTRPWNGCAGQPETNTPRATSD